MTDKSRDELAAEVVELRVMGTALAEGLEGDVALMVELMAADRQIRASVCDWFDSITEDQDLLYVGSVYSQEQQVEVLAHNRAVEREQRRERRARGNAKAMVTKRCRKQFEEELRAQGLKGTDFWIALHEKLRQRCPIDRTPEDLT